ncbi:MAG: pantetheine-phosphate adenylyltransferase [Patescibacteria group bacterium]|nr:pantetheine-phosphate adenylyltransferase [Patescibacteria group bacterium]
MNRHAAVAGTFDRFHAGHRTLLTTAAASAERLSIGITHPSMTVGKVYSQQIQTLEERTAAVHSFVTGQGWQDRAAYFVLQDIYGPARDDASMDTLVITASSRENARRVNEARRASGMPELELITVPLVRAEDGKPVSSTRIRTGEIDREGRVYDLLFAGHSRFRATREAREQLRVPQGTVYKGPEEKPAVAGAAVAAVLRDTAPPMIIAVGDIVTATLQEQGIEPDLSIVDYRTRRRELPDISHTAPRQYGPLPNEAGTVDAGTALFLSRLIRESVWQREHFQIIIRGEEDLLALPAIMVAPPGAAVLYGQFDQGIVVVLATEEQKKRARTMLEEFKPE